ncbi:psychosine receptor-like [Sparus aurata]|uniref:psychosine receptor-like n=1 Tax=Sparus aurata TaxID=8175 RepID=UPI0011C11A5E|nr:psychosine receptor-like [Sparus aurata]
MDVFNITNNSQDNSYNNSNITTDYNKNSTIDDEYQRKVKFIMFVLECIIISVGLPLTLVAIYALRSMPSLRLLRLIADHIRFKTMVLAFKAKLHLPPNTCQTTCPSESTSLYDISWPAGTAIAECKQRSLSEVETLLCYGASLVRGNHVAPIYVINLLISDLIQFFCMIVEMATQMGPDIKVFFHVLSAWASVGFMLCIALERYLVIAFPLWYRFRRTIKITVAVSVAVWVLSLAFVLPLSFWVSKTVWKISIGLFFLLPFPLLIFFLGGTINALSASRVSSDEKRRIVGVLVLVLLNYTLLYLPTVISFLAKEFALGDLTLWYLSYAFRRLSPLADLLLYIFMRKGIIDKLLIAVCCCRMNSIYSSRMESNDVCSSSV